MTVYNLHLYGRGRLTSHESNIKPFFSYKHHYAYHWIFFRITGLELITIFLLFLPRNLFYTLATTLQSIMMNYWIAV